MNFLFRTFIFFGVLVVLALFSALVAPYWIDWEQFTDEFEKQATRVVGQPVNVGGEANLRLLPLPFISFENLEVGAAGETAPLMTVERFSLQAELLPFLSGKIKIVEMAMERPHLNLNVEENGTVAWTTPSEPIVDPEQVKIEKLVIENGSATVTGLAGGRSLEVQNLTADLAARSVLGPWSISGSGDVDGVRSDFSISTGSYQSSQKSIRLRVSAHRSDRPYNLSLDGPLRLEDNVLSWNGEFGLTPFSSAELAEMDQPETPLPVKLDGIFSATPEAVIVPEYRLEIGAVEDPYVVTGRAQAELKEKVFFRLQADGRQIDLDRIQSDGGGEQQTSTLEARLEGLRSVLNRVPVPDAEGEIDILLPAIVAGDTFIRDVKAVVRPYGRGWDVRSLTSEFPGNTTLEASGRVGLKDDFGFTGRLLIASRQPSGFAAWVSGEVSPQIRRLRVVGLDSEVTISANQARFDNLELRLDDALMTGRLQWLGAGSSKPAIIAELVGNRINTEDLRALYSLARSDSGSDLATHDLNVKVRADLLEAAVFDLPVEASDVDAQIQIRDGSVSVERFNAENLFGATFRSAGRIEDVLNRPNGNLRLKISADQGQQLFDFLNRLAGENAALAQFAANPDLVRDIDLEFELDTTSNSNNAKGIALAKGKISGTSIDARASFDGAINDRSGLPFEINGKLDNPDPSVLLQQFGFETFPVDLAGDVDGPLAISVSTKGTMRDGLQSQIGFTAPGANLTMDGNIVLENFEKSTIDVATTIGARDVLPWLRLLGYPVPTDGASELPVSARFNLKAGADSTALNDLTGQVAGNRFSGGLELQKTGVARPRFTGELKLDHLPVESLAELALGRYEAASLVSQVLPDEELNFGNPLYPGFDANVKLSADTISLGNSFDGEDGKLEFVLIDGAIDFNDVSFRALDGQFSGNGSLKNTNGTVLARGSFLLEDFAVEELADEHGLGDTIDGKGKLSASIETSGLSVSSLISNLTGNGFVEVGGVEISGIDLANFEEILIQTDVEGYEIKKEEVERLVDATLLKGSEKFDSLNAPFSVSRGRVRLRNVTKNTETANLTGNLEVELLNSNAEAELSVAFLPERRDAISGADPQVRINWIGPLGALEKSIDASQLEGYLSLRAFETSQRRLETLEARVIEKQRHLRQIALSFAREKQIEREEEKSRLLLEQQKREEEEAERQRQEAAAKQAEEERLEAERAAEEERLREEAERLEAERVAEEERLRREAEEREAQRVAEEERQRLEAERLEREQAAEEERLRIEAEQLAEEERLQEEAEKLSAEQRAAADAANLVAPTPAPEPDSTGIRSTPLPPVRRTQPAPRATQEAQPRQQERPRNLIEALERLLSPR